MRKQTILIAMAAFMLGALVTATLTSTARAQNLPNRRDHPGVKGFVVSLAPNAARYDYRSFEANEMSDSEAHRQLSLLGQSGWEAYGHSVEGKQESWELKRPIVLTEVQD